MSRRVSIVTGGNGGIGYETALALAGQGWHVFVASRSVDAGNKAVEEIKKQHTNAVVEVLQLDLADFKSVRACAAAFLERKLPLHALVNNAGIMAVPFARTVDGHESQFQVNHLSHFLLTQLLWDTLTATGTSTDPARVINVSSHAHFRWQKNIDYDELATQTAENYHGHNEYGRSKLANILYTMALARRGAPKVVAFAVHPGMVATQLLVKIGGTYEGTPAQTPAKGALTSILCATSPDVLNNNGGYYYQSQPYENRTQWSKDANEAEKLFVYSLKVTGLEPSSTEQKSQ
jgi:NAD(P)-dependent dehydrogenase (short-subunit alcohol dehydrogenase family)